jgi:hypothetical protein
MSDKNETRTITLTEVEWRKIQAALEHHAKTQEALGWTVTAEAAREFAAKLSA